jgi:hypothetical protein
MLVAFLLVTSKKQLNSHCVFYVGSGIIMRNDASETCLKLHDRRSRPPVVADNAYTGMQVTTQAVIGGYSIVTKLPIWS